MVETEELLVIADNPRFDCCRSCRIGHDAAWFDAVLLGKHAELLAAAIVADNAAEHHVGAEHPQVMRDVGCTAESPRFGVPVRRPALVPLARCS